MRFRFVTFTYYFVASVLAITILYSIIRPDIVQEPIDRRLLPSTHPSIPSTTAEPVQIIGLQKLALELMKQPSRNVSGICFGLCSSDPTVPQINHVNSVLKKRIAKKPPAINMTAIAAWGVPISMPRQMQWIFNGAALFKGGSMPKLGLQLTMATGENKTAVFKPRLDGALKSYTPCSGFDRYDSELAAYYFRRAMDNFVETTVAIGVRLDLKDLWPVRDEHLQNNSWITDDGRYCVRFVCIYCERLVVCADKPDRRSIIEGSLSFWIPQKLNVVQNPWSSDCAHKGMETWRSNPGLCPQNFVRDQFYGHLRTLLDVVDAGIFDYLVGNPDRHTFEYWEDRDSRHVILLDNGKAFPNADYDDAGLLASLFQCCIIRNNTYSLLHRHSNPTVIIRRFVSEMASDPLYPFLEEPHIAAIPQRIRKAISVINLCVEKYGSSEVIITD